MFQLDRLSRRERSANHIKGTLRAAALFLAAGTLLACSEPSGVLPADPNDAISLENGAMYRMEVEPGLEQTIEVENQRLHPGDILRLRSVVRNVGNTEKKAEALVCQLEIRTDMEWEPIEPLILCFAYSIQATLAPRDSLVLTAAGRIQSRPGQYTMIVRHLLRPDIKARVRIPVYPQDE